METKVFFKVYRCYLYINEETKIAQFEKEEDALNYARLSKMNEPRYDFKVVKVAEENIFSTEE